MWCNALGPAGLVTDGAAACGTFRPMHGVIHRSIFPLACLAESIDGGP
jgi:hypothetical protein